MKWIENKKAIGFYGLALPIGGFRQRLLTCVVRTVGDIEEKDSVIDERLDDLDFVEIIMEVESEFDTTITEGDKRMEDFEKVKDLIDWLEPNVSESDSELLCECGGNQRIALDCTMQNCKHPKY